VAVPLDYANPAGKTITIALARHPATGKKFGSLVFNPGGPGASGIDYLDTIVADLSPSIVTHFDLVGFDARGVGRSSPVRCASGPELDQWYHLNPAPTTASGFQQLVDATKAYVAGCQARSGGLLPFVGTVDTARDMDAIRGALGDAKLTYLGFSYGTFLGATYADLFPTHIRAMVLDGAQDPALDPTTSVAGQAAGFDAELNAFFQYCPRDPHCPWPAGSDIKAGYDALAARITAHPLPAGGTRTVGPGEMFYGVAAELYDPASWPGLADGLARALAGDGSQLLKFFDGYTSRSPNGEYANYLEANTVISCDDQPWSHDLAALQQAALMAKARAPEFGVADMYGGLACVLWPVPPTDKPHVIAAAGSPPVIVVGSTGDPATPYEDAKSLAGELQRGVLLTRVGDGHTGYIHSQCIRDHVDSYLLNLTVPPAGIMCPTP
jgi:pimeloyl-ACP methyl ester carboxylesterase